jgi:hypothetical protein
VDLLCTRQPVPSNRLLPIEGSETASHKQDAEANEDMEAIMRAEECSFMRGLEQSRPVLVAAPGAALGVPYTTRMQVSTWHSIRIKCHRPVISAAPRLPD